MTHVSHKPEKLEKDPETAQRARSWLRTVRNDKLVGLYPWVERDLIQLYESGKGTQILEVNWSD